MVLYVDNQAALQHLKGDGASAESKHVDVPIKFVSSHARSGIIAPRYLERSRIPAVITTKMAPANRLAELKILVVLKQNVSEVEPDN